MNGVFGGDFYTSDRLYGTIYSEIFINKSNSDRNGKVEQAMQPDLGTLKGGTAFSFRQTGNQRQSSTEDWGEYGDIAVFGFISGSTWAGDIVYAKNLWIDTSATI